MRFLRLTLALALVPACTLPRSALGSGIDAGLGDASGIDANGEDAPREDAPGDDAWMPLDDGGADTGSTCTPVGATELRCDRVDDDCDGIVDDDICGACFAFSVAGRAFLSCPAPVTGIEAWTGACRRTAQGYDLAVFASSTEQSAALLALNGRGLTDAHWIGLNDFDVNGTYVWRDRTTTFTPTLIGANDPVKRYVALRSDGTYEELIGNESRRVLCEAVMPPGPCAGVAEAASCNGVDDNCDGNVDEGLACGASLCVARTFWDHVYYACAHMRTDSEATSECMRDTGGPLASIDGPIEHAFLATYAPTDTWIGLIQDHNAPAVDQGWHWLDGSTTYGVPLVRGALPWDSGEPNDAGNGMTESNNENCGCMLSPARGNHFDDRGCNMDLPFFCERPWTW